MEMLAQGGYVVGKMATLLFPEGVDIEGDTRNSIAQTRELLLRNEVVLFEAAIESGQKIIRVDILVKNGNKLHLIEVKAKSHNSEEESPITKLKKYTEDVAFQYLVLKEAFPGHTIKCSILMPDKAKRTSIEGLAAWFNIQKQDKAFDTELMELPAQQIPAFNKPNIVFKYELDPDRDNYINQLKRDGVLKFCDVTEEVLEMQPDIKQRAAKFLEILNNGIRAEDYSINKGCKSCEFNTPNITTNGYKECWGSLAYTEPHIFDLYYGGAIKQNQRGYYLDELIAKGKTSLFDIDVERLKNNNGELGPRGQRQTIQIQNTRSNTEWKSPELIPTLQGLQYPLHFIDFETYTGALPFHIGMRPYELIAFQWSCHTIANPGSAPEHAEWIHTGSQLPDMNTFPNFVFAKTLMNQIGTTGTPLMWASHENTVLRTILNQMDVFGIDDPELRTWLKNMTSDKGREGRLVDMNKLTLQHYFHPYMKGRTSIKKVLPAVWSHFPYLHQVEHFQNYAPDEFISGVLDPYDTLTSGIQLEEWGDEVVSGGTAAMRAYYRIRFDESLSGKQKDELRYQLSQYCKLDTMAMVIISHHWGLK